MCVYFWPLNSVPLIYVSVFLPISCCFDYCGFVIQFEIRDHEANNSGSVSGVGCCSSQVDYMECLLNYFMLVHTCLSVTHSRPGSGNISTTPETLKEAL